MHTGQWGTEKAVQLVLEVPAEILEARVVF